MTKWAWSRQIVAGSWGHGLGPQIAGSTKTGNMSVLFTPVSQNLTVSQPKIGLGKYLS